MNGSLYHGFTATSNYSLTFDGADQTTLANSPYLTVMEAARIIFHPQNTIEKALINAGSV